MSWPISPALYPGSEVRLLTAEEADLVVGGRHASAVAYASATATGSSTYTDTYTRTYAVNQPGFSGAFAIAIATAEASGPGASVYTDAGAWAKA